MSGWYTTNLCVSPRDSSGKQDRHRTVSWVKTSFSRKLIKMCRVHPLRSRNISSIRLWTMRFMFRCLCRTFPVFNSVFLFSVLDFRCHVGTCSGPSGNTGEKAGGHDATGRALHRGPSAERRASLRGVCLFVCLSTWFCEFLDRDTENATCKENELLFSEICEK